MPTRRFQFQPGKPREFWAILLIVAAGCSSNTTTNSIGMRMILVPPGEFRMGSPEIGPLGNLNGPVHQVRITKPFYMGAFEVTQAEYRQVMGMNPSWFSATGEGKDKVSGELTGEFPVENVSWDEAQEFCRRLSQKEGKSYRLPTEAEWEYACRAGTTTTFNTGATLSPKQANIMASGYFTPVTVGTYEPNAFGLYDMHGNVSEWVADWYAREYYSQSPVNDPQGPKTGTLHVLRGCSWNDASDAICRCSFRGSAEGSESVDAPDVLVRINCIGFRVVCEP